MGDARTEELEKFGEVAGASEGREKILRVWSRPSVHATLGYFPWWFSGHGRCVHWSPRYRVILPSRILHHASPTPRFGDSLHGGCQVVSSGRLPKAISRASARPWPRACLGATFSSGYS